MQDNTIAYIPVNKLYIYTYYNYNIYILFQVLQEEGVTEETCKARLEYSGKLLFLWRLLEEAQALEQKVRGSDGGVWWW